MKKKFPLTTRGRHIFTLLGLAVLSGCIGTDQIDDLGTVEPRVEFQTTSLFSVDTIWAGQTLQYDPEFYDGSGFPASASFSFASSDPAVASIDGDGIATGLTQGVTTISATANGKTAERLLMVEQLNRVEVTPEQTSVLVGGTVGLTAAYFDTDGNPATATFNWTSDDPAIATVDANGTVSGVAAGQTWIKADVNGVSGPGALVTVVGSVNDVATIQISAASTNLQVGESAQLTATALNVNGDPVTGVNFSWTSSNPSVASVSSSGVVDALALGSTDIVASTAGISSTGLQLVVTPPVMVTRTGTFQGSGSYTVNGTVSMSQDAMGNLQLDFASDFSTDNGPGLYIYLSNTTTGGVDVGHLPQTSGAFTHTLPAGIGINDYQYVLIWCKPFGVTFGSALLQ